MIELQEMFCCLSRENLQFVKTGKLQGIKKVTTATIFSTLPGTISCSYTDVIPCMTHNAKGLFSEYKFIGRNLKYLKFSRLHQIFCVQIVFGYYFADDVGGATI